jgi:hypothetical protein
MSMKLIVLIALSALGKLNVNLKHLPRKKIHLRISTVSMEQIPNVMTLSTTTSLRLFSKVHVRFISIPFSTSKGKKPNIVSSHKILQIFFNFSFLCFIPKFYRNMLLRHGRSQRTRRFISCNFMYQNSWIFW